jgi:hypothetical protein
MSSAYFCRDLWSEEEFTAEAYNPAHAAEEAAEHWDRRGSVVEERDVEVKSEMSGEKLVFTTKVELTRTYDATVKEEPTA